MAVRRFNGTSDEIKCSIGSCNLTGAFTLVNLIRPQAAAAASIMSNFTSGGTEKLGQGLNASKQSRLLVNGTGLTGAEIEVTPTTSQWGLWIVTKEAGTKNPRWHFYGFDKEVWKHVNDGSTLGNPESQASGTVRFGNGAEGFAKVDFAACAQWSKVLSDAEIETLKTLGTLYAWKTLSPAGLWLFNQGAVGTEITDQTGNGANQSARSGTEVLAEEPPIPYGIPQVPVMLL